MPDAIWAVSRFSPRLIPGQRPAPGFDAVHTLSTLPQRFTYVRSHDPHLIPSCGTFSLT
ncbi:MAG TPA: transposase [Methanophagales archaeon]|nr:transposase [Methanophagales archaeon]